MKHKLKSILLLLIATGAASTLNGQTNLLQAVSVSFTVYHQGSPVVHGTPPVTNNVVDKSFFGTKDLIAYMSTTGQFNRGDLLVRVTPVTNNTEGAAYWGIYNTVAKYLEPVSTNVYFNIHTTHVYSDTNALAYMHGETVKKDGVIDYGSTDEIRSLILSNSATQIRLQGYAHGKIVPVSLSSTPSTNVVYSQNYHWEGNGSGILPTVGPAVLDGYITEDYYKSPRQ